MFSASFRQGITTETRTCSVSGADTAGTRLASMPVWSSALDGSGRSLERGRAPRSGFRRGGVRPRRSQSGTIAHMTICLVYDCLYPHTVGGAERWYRNLALRLAADRPELPHLLRGARAPGPDPGG